jgi:hypothetical protein
MKKSMLVLPMLVGLAACGGGSNGVTGSSGSSMPQVGGSYSGTMTLVYPELAGSMSCPASTAVTQSGSTVNMAPIIATGQCAGISFPLGTMSIDSTGAIDGGSGSGSYVDPSCGAYSYTASGGFFGREFRLSMNAVSATCYNYTLTWVLSR